MLDPRWRHVFGILLNVRETNAPHLSFPLSEKTSFRVTDKHAFVSVGVRCALLSQLWWVTGARFVGSHLSQRRRRQSVRR